jgi:hypothetical protein
MDQSLWLLLGVSLAFILIPLVFFDVRERLHHRETRKRGRRRSDKIRLQGDANERLMEMPSHREQE